jgi:hypothetical protein
MMFIGRVGRKLLHTFASLCSALRTHRPTRANRVLDVSVCRTCVGARWTVRGYFNARVSGFCKELWERRERLWTFVDVEGVQPTNNAAEQALRHAVIWRKLSFGTQSKSGSQFVERLLTVIETCRRQERNVFAWLTDAVRAHHYGQSTPSLLFGV